MTSGSELKCTKPLSFVLDEPKPLTEAKKKKGKKATPGVSGLTSKNFGSYANISKLKSSPSLVTAWRCRLLASQACLKIAPSHIKYDIEFNCDVTFIAISLGPIYLNSWMP